MPDHILTTNLLARFEEAGAMQDVAQREEELSKLVEQLPNHNKDLLSWLIVHFDHITQYVSYLIRILSWSNILILYLHWKLTMGVLC